MRAGSLPRNRVIPKTRALTLPVVTVLRIAFFLALIFAGLSLPFLITSWIGPVQSRAIELKASSRVLSERLEQLEARFEVLQSELAAESLAGE
ncbi:MAG TPA: hypothetical protein DHV12_00080 [Thermotogae bacterium]|nr:hypothetical protein [Thermotogota bacterium]